MDGTIDAVGVTYTTTAQRDSGGLLLIEVPERVVRALGDRRRVPVRVDLNGVRYRSTIAVYGERYYLPAQGDPREGQARAWSTLSASHWKLTARHGRWPFLVIWPVP
jgi:hypothetical protein